MAGDLLPKRGNQKPKKEKEKTMNRYLPIESEETEGGLRPKTVVLTERQIQEIEELVMEFRKGHFPTTNFSSFIRLMIECGKDEAIHRMSNFGTWNKE